MAENKKIKLVECPRDAMQGWKNFIATPKKINYINALLKVGFDTIDFGSFVSPKAIPQMADTAAVLAGLQLNGTISKLLAIVANTRGAEQAVEQEAISCLGFPFSVSPTFQQRNTNSTIQHSVERVGEIQNLCIKNNKTLVVYISMGFGNPYGDAYSKEIVLQWIDKLVHMNIKIISLADTVGVAAPEQVSAAMQKVMEAYPAVETGVHLHSSASTWKPKLAAAFNAGCTRFDGALKGIGGCPMAGDLLVGNMDTEKMINYFDELNLPTHINRHALADCTRMAAEIFI